VARRNLSRKSPYEATATNNGLAVTSTTELATVVCERDAIQRPKCNARNPPASRTRRHSVLISEFISPRERANPQGRRTREAITSRPAAIARAGASASLMNMAAPDMATTPRARTTNFLDTLFHCFGTGTPFTQAGQHALLVTIARERSGRFYLRIVLFHGRP